MSKIVNIQIDEGATFTKVLKFTRKVKTGEEKHPITNEVMPIYSVEPIPLAGYSISAQIRAEADPSSPLLASFSAGIASGTNGMAYLSMSKEQTARLGNIANLRNTDTQSKRVFTIGYYDILLTSSEGKATRVYEGKCYLNRAVTLNPLASTGKYSSVNRSPITELGKEIELPVDSTNPHYFVGIRYLNAGIQVKPTGGTVTLYRMPQTSNTYQKSPIGILAAQSPESELSWYGNTKKVKASPSGVTGATAYQVVVVSNRS